MLTNDNKQFKHVLIVLALIIGQIVSTIVLFWIHERYFGTNLSQDLSWSIPLIISLISAYWLIRVYMKMKFIYLLIALGMVGLIQLLSMLLSVAICGE